MPPTSANNQAHTKGVVLIYADVHTPLQEKRRIFLFFILVLCTSGNSLLSLLVEGVAGGLLGGLLGAGTGHANVGAEPPLGEVGPDLLVSLLDLCELHNRLGLDDRDDRSLKLGGGGSGGSVSISLLGLASLLGEEDHPALVGLKALDI